MTTHAEVAAVLDAAADKIDPAKGGRWIRGAAHDGAGGHCILGALSEARYHAGLTVFHPVHTAAWTAVQVLIDADISTWNDHRCLDGAEALNVLRKAAEIERAS
jgi:hypothetical protein